MQFHRKTSNRLSNGLINILIKLTIIIFLISAVIIVIDRIGLPAPSKSLQKKIPNEQFKVIK